MVRESLRAQVGYLDGRVLVKRRALIGIAVGVYLLALGLALWGQFLPDILAVPPIVVSLSLVPGVLCLLLLRDIREFGAKIFVYAFGLSLVLLMLLGLGLNLGLPQVDIVRPLSLEYLVGAITLLVIVLAIAGLLRFGNGVVEIVAPPPTSPFPLALVLLPLVSVLGVTVLNRTGDNSLLLVALGLAAIVPFVVWVTDVEQWHSFAIWAMALAVLYHDALYVSKSFPGNPVVVRIWNAARWVPGPFEGGPLSTELLQHGTIFPMFAILADVNIMAQMVIVNPVFVSVIPVALFVAFRHYVPSKHAFVGASMFVFAHPFYNQYTTAGRSATPVLFLALFALVLSEFELSRPLRAGLGLVFLSCVVVTHYGTAYFTLVALVGAVVVSLLLWLLDYSLDALRVDRYVSGLLNDSTPWNEQDRSLLSMPLVGFFTVVVFSWFLYTNGGRAFALLPRHASRSFHQLVSGEAGLDAGRTAARLQRDYEAAAIAYSKYLYIFIGILVAIGLLATIVRRFRRSEEYSLDDHFFVLGGMMLGLFGTTLIVRTWGGGRPMMITFVFTLLFAIIGVMWLGEGIERFSEWLSERTATGFDFGRVGADHVGAVFAVVIAVLFVLNSGVASALVLSGSAPSTVPLGDGESDLETDMETHAWLVDHYQDGNVYGDYNAFTDTDANAPAIAARTEDGSQYGPERPRGDVLRLNQSGAGPGFLLMLGHNLNTGSLHMYLDRSPLGVIRDEYRQNKIYSTGQSEIYYFGDT